MSDKYITGDPNRQELLEKALKGICDYQGMKDITEYMAKHKSDKDADELWQYFQDVINWIMKIFPQYYADMKGLDWCCLYNKYHKNTYNSSDMKDEVKRLHEDEDVQKPKGIYEYLLSRDFDPFAEKHLKIRVFSERDKWTLTVSKTEFAQSANNILSIKKWKATISFLGARADTQLPKTVRCFAKTVTEKNQIYSNFISGVMPDFYFEKTNNIIFPLDKSIVAE